MTSGLHPVSLMRHYVTLTFLGGTKTLATGMRRLRAPGDNLMERGSESHLPSPGAMKHFLEERTITKVFRRLLTKHGPMCLVAHDGRGYFRWPYQQVRVDGFWRVPTARVPVTMHVWLESMPRRASLTL